MTCTDSSVQWVEFAMLLICFAYALLKLFITWKHKPQAFTQESKETLTELLKFVRHPRVSSFMDEVGLGI